MNLESGTRLGQYKIREKLSEGDSGVVYGATDVELGRKVALKILPTEDPNVPWVEQTPEEVASRDGEKRFFPWSWSPDGKWLAGDWLHDSGAFDGIGLLSLESREFATLSEHGSGPAFLSDSRRLLFRQGAELYLIDRETREQKVVSGAPPMDLAQVSADDRSLFYTHRTEEADIWLLSAATEEDPSPSSARRSLTTWSSRSSEVAAWARSTLPRIRSSIAGWR